MVRFRLQPPIQVEFLCARAELIVKEFSNILLTFYAAHGIFVCERVLKVEVKKGFLPYA